MMDSGEHLTVVKTVEESQFLVLPRAEFIKIAHEFPVVFLRLAGVLTQRLRKMEESAGPKGFLKGFLMGPSGLSTDYFFITLCGFITQLGIIADTAVMTAQMVGFFGRQINHQMRDLLRIS